MRDALKAAADPGALCAARSGDLAGSDGDIGRNAALLIGVAAVGAAADASAAAVAGGVDFTAGDGDGAAKAAVAAANAGRAAAADGGDVAGDNGDVPRGGAGAGADTRRRAAALNGERAAADEGKGAVARHLDAGPAAAAGETVGLRQGDAGTAADHRDGRLVGRSGDGHPAQGGIGRLARRSRQGHGVGSAALSLGDDRVVVEDLGPVTLRQVLVAVGLGGDGDVTVVEIPDPLLALGRSGQHGGGHPQHHGSGQSRRQKALGRPLAGPALLCSGRTLFHSAHSFLLWRVRIRHPSLLSVTILSAHGHECGHETGKF